MANRSKTPAPSPSPAASTPKSHGASPSAAAYFAARNTLAEKGLPGAAEIDLTGDGDFRLDAGLPPGERTGRVEDGMPSCCYIPGVFFFCGRADEFRAVARALADPVIRGYAFWGMGGIGKTALAKEAARRNAWRFRDGGVVFVDAGGIAPPTTMELLRLALARLAPAAQGDDPVFELVTRLTAAPGLIVFDNLEILPKSEYDALAHFVDQVPANGSHVLLTARVPIRPIEDLPGVPTRLLTSGLDDYDGAVYAHRIAETKGVALLRDDPPIQDGEVRGLCARLTRRVSGHPRMIEVAVGIARRGQAELDTALDRLDGDLESKLNEMLATGLALVGDEGRRLLAFLPLFPAGNFTLEAMRAACAWAERATVARQPAPAMGATLRGRLAAVVGRLLGMPGPPAPDGQPDDDENESGSEDAVHARVVEGIRQLELGGFLDRDQVADYFTFHQTLRNYAERAMLLSTERHSIAFFGLLRFYAEYLRANSGNHQAIDHCLGNALTLMETAWTARPGPGPLDVVLAGMVDALGYYFEGRGLWLLGDRWIERAITLQRELGSSQDHILLAHELYKRAVLLRRYGQHDEAVKCLRESLQLSERTNHRQGQAATLHELAIIEHAHGRLDEARRLICRSRGIQKQLRNLQGLAASLNLLAVIKRDQNKAAMARRLIQRAISIQKRLEDRYGQTASLNVLATIERGRGNLAEARRLIQEAIGIREKLGDVRGLATSRCELAIIEHDDDNPTEARRLIQWAICIQERLGDLFGLAASLHVSAMIERYQGDTDEARRLWEQSIALQDRIGNVEGRASSLIMLAQLESSAGNREKALGIARESVQLLEGAGNAKAATAREILARIESSDGRGSAETPKSEGATRGDDDVSER